MMAARAQFLRAEIFTVISQRRLIKLIKQFKAEQFQDFKVNTLKQIKKS